MSNEKKICRCCKVRPVGGYVARHRITLDNLCTRCWKGQKGGWKKGDDHSSMDTTSVYSSKKSGAI
jgi:hypothetical protein